MTLKKEYPSTKNCDPVLLGCVREEATEIRNTCSPVAARRRLLWVLRVGYVYIHGEVRCSRGTASSEQ